MNSRGFIPAILLVLAAAVSGCQTLQEVKGKDALKNTLNSYAATLRWGDPAQAYNFLRPEEAEQVEVPEGLNNVRVTGYELASAPTYLSDHVVTQTVVIEYVFEDRQVYRTLTDRQFWEYDVEEERWYRTNAVPPFK